MATNTGLATLFDLNDSIIAQGHGCWVKIEAWEVPKSDEMPHGIRYSLTLHRPLAPHPNPLPASGARGQFVR